MRTLIVLLIAALATACAAPSSPLSSASVPARMVAFGTLASVGTCEWRLAGEYTALAVARYRAAAALDARRIDVPQARRVQALADQARLQLDHACGAAADEARERAAAAAARELMSQIENVIGG